MHLSSVDLPEPLRPTMPKNSPCATSNDTPRSACRSSCPDESKGCRTRSLRVLTRRWGRRKVFETWFTVTVGAPPVVAPAAPGRSAVVGTRVTLAAGRRRARPENPCARGEERGLRARAVVVCGDPGVPGPRALGPQVVVGLEARDGGGERGGVVLHVGVDAGLEAQALAADRRGHDGEAGGHRHEQLVLHTGAASQRGGEHPRAV